MSGGVSNAPSASMIDRAKLDAIVAPIAQAQGGEVVDIEWKTEAGGWILRVFVEKLGAQQKSMSTKEAAVTLELCANIARELSPALDADESFFTNGPSTYSLEVSSPGVERALKKPADFARFVGDKAKLWLKKAALPRGAETGNGQRVVEGRLEAFQNDVIVVRDGGRTYDLPFADVDRARLVFELETGEKQKPGKPGKPGKQNSGPKKQDKLDKLTVGKSHESSQATRPSGSPSDKQ